MNWRNILEEIAAWVIVVAMVAAAVVLWVGCGKREMTVREWFKHSEVASEAFFTTNDSPVFVAQENGRTFVASRRGTWFVGVPEEEATNQISVITDGTNVWHMSPDGLVIQTKVK